MSFIFKKKKSHVTKKQKKQQHIVGSGDVFI